MTVREKLDLTTAQGRAVWRKTVEVEKITELNLIIYVGGRISARTYFNLWIITMNGKCQDKCLMDP